MTSIDIGHTATIAATADELWRVLGEEFAEVGRWASAVDTSAAITGEGRAGPDPAAAGRTCQVAGFGETEETLVLFDRQHRRLAYTATAQRIPSFVRGLRNEWSIDEIDPGTSEVTSHVTAEVTGILGVVIAPLLRRKLSSTLRTSLEDLRAYAENGLVSEAKRKATARRST